MNRTQPASRAVRFEETAPVIPPAPAQLFEKRSARLRSLSSSHKLGAYLETMAMLAKAQILGLQEASREENRSSLPLDLHDRHHGPAWRKALGAIISEMLLVPLPEPSRIALSYLTRAQPAELESAAHTILNGDPNTTDRTISVFIAAALQAYWTGLASAVQVETVAQPARVCPVCASPPVAGIILSGRNLRYLSCSLCGTQWYAPRLICANCGATEGISYFSIDGDSTGTRAEACGKCSTYLKLLCLENNPAAEAYADDLATLALDLLVSEQGYSRNGINLFLL